MDLPPAMINKIIRLFKKEYQALNKIEISKENLLQNYKHLSSLNRKVKIAPVLKSNAYGHGLVQIASVLDPLKCPYFCVDSLFEAYQLLKAKIKTPILIMGYTDPENLKFKKLPFNYAVSTIDLAETISKYQPQAGIHIFVDTGMHREGIPLSELAKFLQNLPRNLKVEGLMSHLASADESKDPLNKQQIKNFKKALAICKKHKIKPKWIHMQNSDGVLNTNVSSYPTLDVCNMARVGLALYGISIDPNLKPILTLKSKIIQIKKLKKGDRVGYGGTFTTKVPTAVGILPLGYYDGLNRRLSNKGVVLVDGISCPIIGRVSMNITTIDLSKVPNPFIGQEVLIYSNNPEDKNSIQNAAKICKTIPYDILIGLSASTKRIYEK